MLKQIQSLILSITKPFNKADIGNDTWAFIVRK